MIELVFRNVERSEFLTHIIEQKWQEMTVVVPQLLGCRAKFTLSKESAAHRGEVPNGYHVQLQIVGKGFRGSDVVGKSASNAYAALSQVFDALQNSVQRKVRRHRRERRRTEARAERRALSRNAA